MILEAQQIERVESENRASPVEARERLAARRDELTSRLREALEATVFSNRFLLPPRRLPQIARAEADAFLDFLKTGDADRIREQGAKRAEEGLGEQAMLRLGTTLRQFCRDYPADETLRAADVYTNALLEGFMEGREAIVLEEQEQIRKALQGVISRYALQLTTAAEVSRAASSILDLAELLPEVVNLIRDRFNFYYVGLFLLDASGEYAVLRAGTGEAGRQMLEMGHKLEVGGTSMIGWCTAHSKARIALDVGKEAVRFDNPLLPETRSEMALPLISRGRVIGAMTIQSTKPAAFSEEDTSVLQTMADQLANAIENARLFEETLARTREIAALAETGKKLASTLELDAVLDSIMDACLELFQVQQACFIMMDKDGYLRMRRHRGLSEEFVRSIVGRPGEGFFGKVYQSGEPILVRDAREQLDPATAKAVLREGVTSFVHVPVKVKGETVAVMNLTSLQEDRHFDERDLERLSAFADQAAIAIENARLFEETQRRMHELAMLFNASQTLASAPLQPEEIAEIIAQQFVEMMGVEEASVSLLDPEGTMHVLADLYMGDEEIQREKQQGLFRLGDYPATARVMETLQPLVIQASDPDADPAELAYMRKHGVVTLAIIPLAVKGRSIGVIELESFSQERHYTREQLNLAMTLANEAAVMLENARLFEETQRRAEQTAALRQMNIALTSTLKRDQILEMVLDQLKTILDYDSASIQTLSGPHTVHVVAARPPSHDEELRKGFDASQNPLFYEMKDERKVVVIDDVRLDDRWVKIGDWENVRSWVGVPLFARDNFLGFLNVEKGIPGFYKETEVQLLRDFAQGAALAIENARLFEETQRRAVQLETAAEVSRAATSILDTGQLLTETVNLIRDRFDLYYAGIFLLDEAGQYAVLQAGTGEAGQQMLEQGHKLEVGGTSMIGWCTAHSKARIALDVGEEAVRFDNPLLPETRSEMALPLISRGRVIGAMTIQSDKPAAFSEEDIAALQTMADQLANAIENARLFEEEQAQRRLADNLLEITRTVGSTLDLEEVLNLILEQLGQVVDYDSTAILLVEGDELRATALRGFKDEEKKQFTFPWKEMEHLRHPLETKEPLVIADTRQQPSWRDELGTTHIRSWIGVPLVSKGKAIGLLTIDSAKLNHFSQREAQLAALFAGQVATAIENARLFQETRANLEEITLLHRRYLQEAWGEFLEEETGRERAGYIYERGTVSPASTIWRPEIGLAVQQGETIALSDMADALRGTVEEVGAILQASPAQSALAVPLKVRGQVIGALDFYETGQTRDWSAEDIAMVEAVANQVALAIENARAYEELQKTAEQLKEMDRLKTQFLANMSHELRTPLNSIIGFSRVILKGIDGPITEQQRADLTSIYNNGQHLLGMINDILDISKIEAGKMELIFETVDVQQIISGVMSTATALVRDKPIELKQEVAPNLPIIRADGTRLRQVILNLLSNAAKFTEEGQITLRAWADEEQITISVKDTGIGIPPEHQTIIFEEFHQVDTSTTRRTGGTGLGLAITRHFVEMHGGHIWVESEPGVGSTFTFTLPITGPASVESELAALSIDPKRKLILVVEDDKGAISIYRRYLEKQGYQVVGLNQGEQAVRWALELSPHAIILDVLLPDKDGWAVLEELKSSRETHQIPVIICTIIDEEARGLSLGAADYLVKPILEEDLLRSLQRLEERQRI